jgi:uncharacterized protein (TIGR02001 family)
MRFRKLIAAGVCAAAFAPNAAVAQDLAPPYTLSANVYLVSDYYFRGLTQTWHEPAIQGGFDFAHSSGFYVGTWASNVSSKQFPGGSMEWDFYGGYNHKLSDDVTIGAGGIYYYYPGAKLGTEDFETGEVYVNASWKWLSAKVSYALTDYFGGNANTGFVGDTDGTMYFDLTANFPLPVWEGLTLVAHAGYTLFSEDFATPVNGETDPSYADWKIGITKTWSGGWNVGVFYVQAGNDFWENTGALDGTGGVEDLNEATVVVQVGRTF